MTNPRDIITITWSIEDVLSLEPENDKDILSNEEARDVLALADKHHDACHGICWDTLEVYIGIILSEREKKGNI